MKSLKKFLALAVIAAAFGLIGPVTPAFAAGSDYTIALTTYGAKGTVADFTLGAFPNVTGGMYLRKLVVAPSTGTVIQTVSLYDTCTSTTAATLVMRFFVGAGTNNGVVAPIEFNWLPQSFRLTSPCINRSDTTGTTQATFFYE